jgi:hypothetical protein
MIRFRSGLLSFSESEPWAQIGFAIAYRYSVGPATATFFFTFTRFPGPRPHKSSLCFLLASLVFSRQISMLEMLSFVWAWGESRLSPVPVEVRNVAREVWSEGEGFWILVCLDLDLDFGRDWLRHELAVGRVDQHFYFSTSGGSELERVSEERSRK